MLVTGHGAILPFDHSNLTKHRGCVPSDKHNYRHERGRVSLLPLKCCLCAGALRRVAMFVHRRLRLLVHIVHTSLLCSIRSDGVHELPHLRGGQTTSSQPQNGSQTIQNASSWRERGRPHCSVKDAQGRASRCYAGHKRAFVGCVPQSAISSTFVQFECYATGTV